LVLGATVVFRHPLVRSAVYRSSDPDDRSEVHRALAEATDPEIDPDRRSWHRAQAASMPDEEVAAELERSAARAQARGGFAAAAAFLERAVTLTPEPSRRAQRALAAAETKFQAGALDDALGLLGTADNGELSALERARVVLRRAQIAFVTTRGNNAAPLLLEAADRLADLDPALARETYLEALVAAGFAGPLAGAGASALEVARAARAAPPPASPTPRGIDLLLDGLATLFSEGYEAAVPILRQAQNSFATDVPAAEELRWGWAATVVSVHLWDDERWDTLSERHVRLARETGALADLQLALSQRISMHLFAGELSTAASLVEELQATTEATGTTLAPYGRVGLLALRGREAEAATLIVRSRLEVTQRGEGIGISALDWAEAVLYNGLGRYEEARAAAARIAEHPQDLAPSNWHLAELIEAAVRAGTPELAADAHRRLAAMTRASSTDWGLGIAARSEALLVEGQRADDLYVEAIDRLGRSRIAVDLARAHLLYGEWLRRERRRIDARTELRTAHELFSEFGMEAFAERARVELEATGERARKRTADTLGELTPQEAQISRLAAQRHTNREIAAQLFISPSTVEYHLRKVFRKVGVTSRKQLANRLGLRTGIRLR
jgi:DNA-binding CsgD family transcriptional regulator